MRARRPRAESNERLKKKKNAEGRWKTDKFSRIDPGVIYRAMRTIFHAQRPVRNTCYSK